jgi:hypothetical protein
MVFGATLASLPKTTANKMAPNDENSQPNRLIDPNAAKDAGNKNTPEPIILPTTRDVLDQNPIFLLLIMLEVL